jgi:hypothetical protein
LSVSNPALAPVATVLAHTGDASECRVYVCARARACMRACMRACVRACVCVCVCVWVWVWVWV